MKPRQVKSTARRVLTDWDYSKLNLNDIFRGDGVIDFYAMTVKVVIVVFHVLCVITLPVSVFAMLYIGRAIEIRNLKSWVKTMRRDKSFFSDHYYIEIKRHIELHKSSYDLTVNW